jgi:hypothetical protein
MSERLARGAAVACLAAPLVGLLWVPWYASAEPRLLGTPFFYWYQLAWIPGSAVLMALAYRLTRPAPPPAAVPPDTHLDQGGPA